MPEEIEPLPRRETIAVVGGVLAPLIGRGLIVRRPRTVGIWSASTPTAGPSRC